MLLWDLPGIAAGVRTLRSSRLAAIYNEIGPVLTVFAKLFGKALEAQVRDVGQERGGLQKRVLKQSEMFKWLGYDVITSVLVYRVNRIGPA